MSPLEQARRIAALAHDKLGRDVVRFEEQRARGATAVRVRPGQPAERIQRFDPNAEEIVMIPRVVGG